MTNNSASIEAVVKTVTLACTPEEAFRYFTADFGMWWPSATQSVVAYASGFKDKPASVILEPQMGGRILERARSREEYVWGTILAWEPPALLAFSFHPGRDEKEAQRVDVTFSSTSEGTKVVLNHSGWENLSSNAQQSRESYNHGWESVFGATYREYVQSAEQSEVK